MPKNQEVYILRFMDASQKRFETKTVPWLRSEIAKLQGTDQDRQDAVKRLAKRKGVWLPLGWAAWVW